MIHYVTYATHDQGLFQTLVKNPHVKIEVLGFGQKWKGFSDKLIGVHKFCQSVREEDYVVFLDGFDCKVIKQPIDIIQRFESYQCDILFSEDITNIFSEKIFGKCNKNSLNSGMYMGKVKHIAELTRNVEKQTLSDDDQRYVTQVCQLQKIDIKCDTEHKVFHNSDTSWNDKYNDYYFIQYPGGRNSFNDFTLRIERAMKEYSKYLYLEMIIAVLLLLLLYLYIKYDFKRKRNSFF